MSSLHLCNQPAFFKATPPSSGSGDNGHLPLDRRKEVPEEIRGSRMFYVDIASFMRRQSIDFTNRSMQCQLVLEWIIGSSEKPVDEVALRKSVDNATKVLVKNYVRNRRIYSRFVRNCGSLLTKSFHIPIVNVCPEPLPSTGQPVRQKKKPFDLKTQRAQNIECRKLREHFEDNAIFKAAVQVARKNGNVNRAQVIKESADPIKASVMKKALEAFVEEQMSKPIDATVALAFLLNNDLSKSQYQSTQSIAKQHKSNIFPPYEHLREKKHECRPDESALTVTESSACYTTSAVLHHTVQRILDDETLSLICHQKEQGETIELEAIFKIGLDGTSGLKDYKQRMTEGFSEESVLFSQLSVLRIWQQSDHQKIIYNNANPSSSLSCRPIRFSFEKESRDSVIAESERLQGEMNNVEPLIINYHNGCIVKVAFRGQFSLIDGKILNMLTDNRASMNCPCCLSTPTQMMDPSSDFEVENPASLTYGASPLHFGLQSFRMLLNISYNMEFKSWQARGDVKKVMRARKKEAVQREMRQQLGLIVDKVKDSGHGTSNDGNTVRMAFKNALIFAAITGIDLDLIKRIHTIWIAISSPLELDVGKFESYCNETMGRYKRLYSWYKTPASFHKILIHGGDIMRSMILPVGCLSEECSEANNKQLKYARTFHARKSTRIGTNVDIIQRLMDKSDPVIVSHKRMCPRKGDPYPAQYLSLLKIPT